MTKKRIKPPHLEIQVILDTNAVYTGSASYFLRKEVVDLVEQQSNLPDLTIRWIVPEVVRHERQFQMLQEANQMLPTIERLERLLGHNLNITPEILETRVREAVDRQVQQHGIIVQPLNTNEVEWPRLVLDAAYRKPPFQVGEKEKGFRDAVILETFLQVVAGASTNRAVTRLALVSNDQLLQLAAQSRIGAAANVHLLDSVDALKGLLNTLGSTVDEQYINSIKPSAAEIFFKAKDESSLYYKESVGDSLNAALRSAEVKLPAGAERYDVEKWTISRPQFVKKEAQRIYWTTRFKARFKALKSIPRPVIGGYSNVVGPLLSAQQEPAIKVGTGRGLASLAASLPNLSEGFRSTYLSTFGKADLISALSSPLSLASVALADDQVVAFGTADLDVSWSLLVTTAGKLTKPRVQSVDFVEVVWD